MQRVSNPARLIHSLIPSRSAAPGGRPIVAAAGRG